MRTSWEVASEFRAKYRKQRDLDKIRQKLDDYIARVDSKIETVYLMDNFNLATDAVEYASGLFEKKPQVVHMAAKIFAYMALRKAREAGYKTDVSRLIVMWGKNR